MLGVHIALDDFGSGYSSLSYLHAFPFEKIKIDRVFVGDLENNHHSMAIVRAIVTLGHSLNIPVLAEGVENESQLSFLAQEGCDEVQGYFTGRPQPIEAYADLVGNVSRSRATRHWLDNTASYRGGNCHRRWTPVASNRSVAVPPITEQSSIRAGLRHPQKKKRPLGGR